MELTLNYFDKTHNLNSSQTYSDNRPTDWKVPFIKEAQICEKTTLYIHDIRSWNVPGKTLIIDSERPPYTTNLTTNSLIKHYVKSDTCRDIFISMIADYLDFQRSCPIVLGTKRIIPLCPSSRTDSDWLFASNLQDIYTDIYDSESSCLSFSVANYTLQIKVPFSEGIILKKLSHAQKISELTYGMMKILSESFEMTTIKPKNEVSCPIDQRIKKFESKDLPINDTFTKLSACLFSAIYEAIMDEPIASQRVTKELIKNSSRSFWQI